MSEVTKQIAAESGDSLIDIEVNESPLPVHSAPRAGGKILSGCSLILVAFNLRTVFPSLAAMLPEIKTSLNLSTGAASGITTLPVVCLGVFAPFAPWLARRAGTERTIFLLTAVLALGIFARALHGITGILVGSVLAGAAIAGVNVLLPGLIKRDFPHATGLMSGLYAMALLGGAATAAGTTAPLEVRFGGDWAKALAFWCVPAVCAILCWYSQLPKRQPTARVSTPRVSGLWRCALAWQLTMFMALQSMYSFTVLGWLAPFLRARGMASVGASLVVSMSILLQTAACLVAPIVAARLKNQTIFNIVVVLMTAIGLLGCLIAPITAVWPWAILQGIGQGALTSVAMTLIVLRSRNAHVAAELSGMVQGVGYGVGAFGPLIVGLLYNPTFGFSRVEIFMGIVGLAMLYFGYTSGQKRYVSGELKHSSSV